MSDYSDKNAKAKEKVLGLFGEAMDLLDYPLRKTKEAVSGDESVWSQYDPSTSREAWAAKQVAGDFLLDPLNFVGGPLKVAFKTPSKLAGGVASVSNYIKNHYGPEEIVPPKVMELLKNDPQKMALYLKAKGAAEHAVKSPLQALSHILSPSSRANFAENSVTNPSQRIVQGHLKNTEDTKNISKGVAQVQYGSHIKEQARSPISATTAPAAQEILNRSFLQGYTKATPGSLSSALQRFAPKVDEGFATRGGEKLTGSQFAKVSDYAPISKEHADFLEKEIFRRQGITDKDQFVIKAPTAKETGGHHHDVMVHNPANTALADAFSKFGDENGNVDPKVLYGYLKETRDAYNKKLPRKTDWSIINPSVEDAVERGIWIKGGKVGSATTEGGVMYFTNIKPNGEMVSYMVDRHDFLGKAGEAATPRGLVAVTPPMMNNIKNMRTIKTKAGGTQVPGKGKRTKTVPKTQLAPRVFQQVPARKGNDMTYPELLDAYTKIVPSNKGVAKAAGEMLGEGLLLQRAFDEDK